ncbi:MAG: hypothetical protein IJP64_05745 [Oscillospiraceae bacterium]|nr:hypothetical protein [Oscillospiraceae bacterium]
MCDSWTKRFPAYMGEDPYLFFCFSDADAARVRPLIERMAARGTRVWYSLGKPRGLDERRVRESRMSGAALVVAYLSAAAREDTDFKNAGLYCRDRGLPILCIDADGDVSALSFGFTEGVQHISRRVYRKASALEEALVRCEGFSQELIGEGRRVPPPYVKIAAVLAVVSVLALALVLLGGRAFGRIAPTAEQNDTVRIEDAALRAAVRTAVGGGAITEENIEGVEALRLKELPTDGEELALLSSLTRVEIPQELAPDALWLLDEGYTVVLYGGSVK